MRPSASVAAVECGDARWSLFLAIISAQGRIVAHVESSVADRCRRSRRRGLARVEMLAQEVKRRLPVRELLRALLGDLRGDEAVAHGVEHRAMLRRESIGAHLQEHLRLQSRLRLEVAAEGGAIGGQLLFV